MNRLNKLDVSAGGPILDINGVPVEQVSVAIAASQDDATAPVIVALPGRTEAKPVWGDAAAGSYGNTQYLVSLAFSETLDARTATNIENYLLGGVHPTSVELSLTGRLVVLSFGELESGLGSADRLQLFSTIRDINGLANTEVTPLAILSGNDTAAPQIASMLWLENALPYQVVVEFNEVMDRDSVEVVDKWVLDAAGAAEKPTAVFLDPSGPTRAVLTFELGAFAATAQLGLSGEVRDISGNAYSGGGIALPAAPSPDPADHALRDHLGHVGGGLRRRLSGARPVQRGHRCW